MRSLVRLRWYRYGTRFLHQLSGIPIGGPVSGAVLEGVLSVDEDYFDRFGWFELASEFGVRGQRDQWITFVRYVDDVFAASFWFCPECVAQMIKRIYSNTIYFDPANDGKVELNGFNVIKFLDLWTYLSWDAVYLSIVNQNDLFSFSGLVNQKLNKLTCVNW